MQKFLGWLLVKFFDECFINGFEIETRLALLF